jgi:histidyl-tRNA synthetase
MTKPSLPQGTRDFGPDVVRKRQYIFNTIRSVFELYGFQPLETPAMENLETLMGKYGEEGDKLIFRILDSGNPFSKDFFRGLFRALNDLDENLTNMLNLQGISTDIGTPLGGPFYKLDPASISYIVEFLVTDPDCLKKYFPKLKNHIAGKALKYDLTIPFARYVAMNHGQLTFPFKRYQIQPVWRADRPQKGRYREFYQCDADVVGSKSLLNEVELAGIYHDVFTRLGLTGYELRINSRKILAALAELCGGADKMTDITIAIDKLDKIGIDKVKEELAARALTPEQVSTIEKYLNISGSNEEKLQQVRSLIGHLPTGQQGIEEVQYVVAGSGIATEGTGPSNEDYRLSTIDSRLLIDFTLARGLNYYTGIIFEAKAPATVKIGSIGGGGRYDDLTGLFGVPNIPGVGISFGVDRIYDVLEELQLFPAGVQTGTQLLFFNLGLKESQAAFAAMTTLRKKGIRCELFHEQAKFDKQFKYAEKKQVPYIAIIGSQEIQDQTCIIKNITTGVQETVALANLSNYLFI